MGCDIHLMAEKKVFHVDDKDKEKGVWINIDKWVVNETRFRYSSEGEKYPTMTITYDDRFYKGRNYNLFTALAGVRSFEFDNAPPIISEPKGFPKDASPQVKSENKRWKGDGHSHSWLTLSEIKAFDWSAYGETCDEFRIVTVGKLEKAKSHYNTDEEIRIVFWFDN